MYGRRIHRPLSLDFATGWSYWFMWVRDRHGRALRPIGVYVGYWLPRNPSTMDIGYWAALVLLYGADYAGRAAWFGEMEFWFALIQSPR